MSRIPVLTALIATALGITVSLGSNSASAYQQAPPVEAPPGLEEVAVIASPQTPVLSSPKDASVATTTAPATTELVANAPTPTTSSNAVADAQALASSAEIAAQIALAKDLSVAFRSASEKILPSVVTILATTKEIDSRDEVLGLNGSEAEEFDSIGSGVISDSSGLIFTNNHVVQDAKRVKVRLYDGREFDGSDIRTDKDSDLATLRITAPDPLPSLPLGNSDKLSVGDWVLAIGSPFSLESTVSVGIISGKSRKLGLIRGQLLQTDAAINPGNSGGPLVNLDGEVIGINTAIATRNGAFEGVGFAIPANRVRWVTNELLTNKSVRRAILGVRSEVIPQKIAFDLSLPIRGGAYVVSITPNKPASKAGVQVGDIIVSLASQPVRTHTDLGEIVEQSPVGVELPIEVLRGKEKLDLKVTLEARQTGRN